MREGMIETPNAVRQVASLPEGEAYCRVEFIPAFRVSAATITKTKRELLQALSPIVARARKLSFAKYRISSIHSMTGNCDVVVAAVIYHEPEETPL